MLAGGFASVKEAPGSGTQGGVVHRSITRLCAAVLMLAVWWWTREEHAPAAPATSEHAGPRFASRAEHAVTRTHTIVPIDAPAAIARLAPDYRARVRDARDYWDL